jgi:hypothetical protein
MNKILNQFIKLILSEGHKNPNPSITFSVTKPKIDEIYKNIFVDILPLVFEKFIKSLGSNVFIFRNDTRLDLKKEEIRQALNENFKNDVINEIINKTVNIDILTMISQKNIGYISDYLIPLELVNPDEPVKLQVRFFIDDFCYFWKDDELIPAGGETEGGFVSSRFDEANKTIILNLAINLSTVFINFFSHYYKSRKNPNDWLSLVNSDDANSKRNKMSVYLAIRHETEHAYQMSNMMIDSLRRVTYNDLLTKPDNVTNELVWLKKSGKINKLKNRLHKQSTFQKLTAKSFSENGTFASAGGYGYLKNSSNDLRNIYNSYDTQNNLKFNRQYDYEDLELTPFLNDFVIIYVSIAKNFFADAYSATKFLLQFFKTDFFKNEFINEENNQQKIEIFMDYLNIDPSLLLNKNFNFEPLIHQHLDFSFYNFTEDFKDALYEFIEDFITFTHHTDFYRLFEIITRDESKYNDELYLNQDPTRLTDEELLKSRNTKILNKKDWLQKTKTFSTEYQKMLVSKINKEWNSPQTYNV